MKTPKDRRGKGVKQANPGGALEADLRRKEAVRLRREGHTFKEIGENLSVSDKTAFQYVEDEWEQIHTETNEQRRALRSESTARMRAALKRLMPLVTHDNITVLDEQRGAAGPVEIRRDAVDTQLRAMQVLVKFEERFARMYGTDAPTKIEDVTAKRQFVPLEELAQKIMESDARKTAEQRRKEFEEEERRIEAFKQPQLPSGQKPA